MERLVNMIDFLEYQKTRLLYLWVELKRVCRRLSDYEWMCQTITADLILKEANKK